MLNNTIQKAKKLYHEYPRTFWILIVITFIDRIGGALLFPFFALYLTSKFDVGMADVGVLFAAFSVSSFVGSAVGGALTDRFGRKGIIIFGLIASSFSTVAMGLVTSFEYFFVLAFFIGILTDVAGPAHQAMIADILPEDKRADGYGILRVAFNLSVVIGPAIGGLLAARSYLVLFLSDAAISLLTVVLIAIFLPETKPEAHPDAPKESMTRTFAGYGQVFRNTAFMLFLGAVLLQVFTYMNMNTSLGVFLRNEHGTNESGYGLLLSINAAMVVLMQFPITRRITKFPPMLMMAAGTFLYVIGFSMYGFVTTYVLFIVAMVIITLGEMVVSPVSQALVASFAPEEMRGRYMAVSGFSWGIPFAIGPYLAGLIIDGPTPYMLWYAAGFVGMLSTIGFLALYRMKSKQAQNVELMPKVAAS
ncbi:MAG: MFS transporter [Anaerolineales bacterium]|uniref:MDR family MFS transporter n=1 Tax=Candidatus Villigracilis affinis TaxID=3140682 RepID=UPI002A1FCB1F|nr:MFS transporter [Anaerolineales bacterium]MBL0343850.1 MFS transporter [Anaerolineales bacterium]